MNICLDIDDSLFPSIQTHFGIINDNYKIFDLNIIRVKAVIKTLEALDFGVAVYIISDLNHSLVLDKQELKFAGNYYKKLYGNVIKTLNKELGGYLRTNEFNHKEAIITDLLKHENNYVIALDDSDLSSINNTRYLYVPVYTFLTNRNLYAIKNFIKDSIKS